MEREKSLIETLAARLSFHGDMLRASGKPEHREAAEQFVIIADLIRSFAAEPDAVTNH